MTDILLVVKAMWSYQKHRVDKKGNRWHFVYYDGEDKADTPYHEKPFEIYFRDDAKTVFGVLRFKRRKDNPYRDWETMVNKI